ncbi:MAG: hypothetical protein JNL14_08610 [Devosia sp.]|uniref:hypothetical protein n=1 Tax=Devosia sp. TaxID=1871048 RepID=UPI001A6395DF|nr:hypothetical protein [Devosia sp.]MBL8597786.1 hypothetical protein [Devosia sp.]
MEIEVEVPSEFQPHVAAAVMRLGYLHPSWTISAAKPNAIVVSVVRAEDAGEARREVTYALYRERIRAEGAPLRELLLKTMVA